MIEFRGLTEVAGEKRDISRRVYQLIDLDPYQLNKNGKTNLDLMKEGMAPYDKNGYMKILHHTIQEEVGPIAELASNKHQKYDKILHKLKNNNESFRNNEILLKQYNNFKS